MSDAPNLRELADQLEPTALRYRAMVERYVGDESLPTALQPAPVAGEIAVLTAYVLRTVGDPQSTGRHNLEAISSLGRHLASLAEEARTREPLSANMDRP